MTDYSLKLYYIDKILASKTEEEKQKRKEEMLEKCYAPEIDVDKGAVNK